MLAQILFNDRHDFGVNAVLCAYKRLVWCKNCLINFIGSAEVQPVMNTKSALLPGRLALHKVANLLYLCPCNFKRSK